MEGARLVGGWLEEGGGTGAATWWLGEGANPSLLPGEPRESHACHCPAVEGPLGFASLRNTCECFLNLWGNEKPQ